MYKQELPRWIFWEVLIFVVAILWKMLHNSQGVPLAAQKNIKGEKSYETSV